MTRLSTAILLAAPLFSAQEVILDNGFRMLADRVETAGDNLRLHTAGGTVEIPRASVSAIEAVESAPPRLAAMADAPPSPPAPTLPAAPKSAKEHLRDAAERTGLPAEFLLSVAKVESALQTKAVSPKGAIGVMQLMPDTARALNVNPHDPAENIEGGARLLRELLLKYEKYPDQVYRALSAYNAGPGAVQKYNGIPPYAETRAYVEKVLNEYHRLKTQKPAAR